MRKLYAIALLAILLVACLDDSESVSQPDDDDVVARDSVVIKDSIIYWDRVVVRDSLVFHDTIVEHDSVVIVEKVVLRDSIIFRELTKWNVVDSVNWRDSVVVIDSINIVDSVLYRDSVVARDSLVAKYVDTLIVVRDSLVVRDSVVIRDTVIVRDSIALKDSVVQKDSVVIKYESFQKDTTVYDTVEVQRDTLIYDTVKVRKDTTVYDTVEVQRDTLIYDTVKVRKDTTIYDTVHVDAPPVKQDTTIHPLVKVFKNDTLVYREEMDLRDTVLNSFREEKRDTVIYGDTAYGSNVKNIPELYEKWDTMFVHTHVRVMVRVKNLVGLDSIFETKCNSANKNAVERMELLGLEHVYVCDAQSLKWRDATVTEKTDFYVKESKVTDFTYFPDLYNSLNDEDRLVVLIRHSERNSYDYGSNGHLNENGKRLAQEVGTHMKDTVSFYYGSSTVPRTHETCEYIAKGRGFDNVTVVENSEALGGPDHWMAVCSSWEGVSMYAYGVSSNTYQKVAPLNEGSANLFETFLIPTLEESSKKVALFASHDYLMLPLIVYVSQQNINLKYHEKKTNSYWPNYMSGIAIVIKPNGRRVYFAVRSLAKGTLE